MRSYESALPASLPITGARTMKIHAHMTDTFSGEANYSWVRNAEFTMPEGASDLAIVRRAKRELSIDSRTTTESHGDELTLRFPASDCLVAFIQVQGEGA